MKFINFIILILKNLYHTNILLYIGDNTVGLTFFLAVTEYYDNSRLFEYLHILKDNE